MSGLWGLAAEVRGHGPLDLRLRVARLMAPWRREALRRRYPEAAEADERTDRMGWVLAVVVILALWALWEVLRWR